MTRICWWLVDRVSRALEPDERDAVRGDFAELGVTAGQALPDLLGLVVRRQAGLWKDWRPWLVLVGLVAPIGVLLSLNSISLRGGYGLYFWIIRNYGVIDPAILDETGLTLRHGIPLLISYSLLMISWCWAAGFVLGSLSRRTIWANGPLFGLVLLFSGGAPFTILLLPPSIWGVRQGLWAGALRLRQKIFLAAAIATLTAFTVSAGGWWRAPIMLLSRFLAVAVLIGCAASAQDYPQWRGPSRDGSASAFSEPKSWPEKLTRRWKVDVGEGYATPIVVGNTVYAFTRRDGHEVMLALDAENGKIAWQTGYAAPYEMAAPTRAHGQGPKATPLFHHGKLYTLGITGIVSAFDAATGKLVWQKPAPPIQPFYGAASSPIGDQDVVMVHPGDYGPLTAFDANTGAVRWTAGGGGEYASPMIVELGGIRQVVTMTQQGVAGVSVTDGALLWQYPLSRDIKAITPILYGETIIVSGHDMGVTALKPVKREGKWVAEVAWETKEVSMFLSNPVLIRDTLFGLSHRASGQFFALDARTGKILWLGQPRVATNTAVVKAGDVLFLLNDDAELIVARSSQTEFEPLKHYTVADSATWAQPAISGNRVFVKDVLSLTLWTLN